ncbi:hypothetical protein BD413DRAFT_211902 [Trametes elegans]|nr:hypothetical protein BD413DRAFT_211902 [Trametes elegans]
MSCISISQSFHPLHYSLIELESLLPEGEDRTEIVESPMQERPQQGLRRRLSRALHNSSKPFHPRPGEGAGADERKESLPTIPRRSTSVGRSSVHSRTAIAKRMSMPPIGRLSPSSPGSYTVSVLRLEPVLIGCPIGL